MENWTRRALMLGAGSAAIAASLPAWATRPPIVGGPAFGTSWRALVPAPVDQAEIGEAMMGVVARIDEVLSPFRPASEITRFNEADVSEWRSVSADMAAVVAEGLRVADLTGGAFDPSVGGIVNRYGFGPIRQKVRSAWSDLELREGKLRKRVAEATFDPCGIAKGHALDLMTAQLEAMGASDFLIELGGEVAARGRHPDGRPWQIGIEQPGSDPISFQAIVRLDECALATSGDALRSYTAGAQSVSHIVDPRTGIPVSDDLASVSVIAFSGMTADALATGLMAMGAKEGPAFAEERAIAAMFVLRQDDRLRQINTSALARYMIA